MTDFVVEGGFDDRAILEGFKKIVTAGTEAGRKVGAGFEDELKRFGARSVASLQAELGKLQSRQLRVNVDSSAFAKTEARIQEIQRLIDLANKKKLLLNADPRSIIAVRARLEDLNTQLQRVAIGSKAFRTLSTQARAAEQQLSGLGGRTGNLAGDLAGMVLPAAGALGAILALGKGLRFVAGQAREFDSASAAVRTLGVDSEALATRLGAVSRATDGLASQNELLRASYDVASAGFTNAADAALILEASAKGATGGFSDINTVANAATSVLNAYGLSADQAGTLIDGFIQTQNDGKIVVAEYAAQIGKLAPIAASAGVSIQELNAAIAVATVSGVKPEAAVTGLRQALQSILKPTSDAEALANQLGIGFSAQSLKAKGLEGVLRDVAKATKGSAALNLRLFGSAEALAAIQPSLTDGLVKYSAALDKQGKSAGVAQKASDEVANTIEGATKRIQSALSNLATFIAKDFAGPTIEALKFVGKAIEDLQTVAEASSLQEDFGFSIQESLQLVGTLRSIEERYKLTGEQSKNLLSNAIANSKAGKDWFGNLKAGGDNFGRVQEGLIDQAKAWSDQRIAGAKAATAAENEVTLSLEEQVAILRQIGASREALTKIQQQVPVGDVSAQLQGFQALLGFSSALAGLESSRFDTVRARNQFEIDNAQRLGITQQGIAARQQANDQLQQQSLIARYQATLQQQKLEQVTLGLKQRQQQIEAALLVLDQQRAVVKAKGELANAQASLDPERIAAAQNALESEQISLGLVQQKLQILGQIAPVERAIAQATAETALQQLRTQGAALGIEQALARITPEQLAFNTAVRDGVQTLTRFPGELNTITSKFGDAAVDAQKLGSQTGDAADAVKDVTQSGIDRVVDKAAGSARSFAGSMSDAAGSAQQLLRYLSSASGISPSRFTGGPVEGGQRYRINDGPGGQSLGQESFLSKAGDLSLIRNPLNSMWTAPSPGIVLPAAVTKTLKGRGAFTGGGGARRAAAMAAGVRQGGPSTARLELAVTNLTAKVDALTRKDWNVTAKVRTSSAGGQLRILNATL